MEALTKKAEVKAKLEQCVQSYRLLGADGGVKALHDHILTKKIRFPLLEFCGDELYHVLGSKDLYPFCDQVYDLKTIGGNVVIAILLQRHMHLDYEASIQKTATYLSKAHIWYICDIIGERVFGHALLTHFDRAFESIEHLMRRGNCWLIRGIGAGVHFSIKRGLPETKARQLFPLLLAHANSKEKEVKQGIGWAAKTTAKFHPRIIAYFQQEIEQADLTSNWFRTKIRIGLERYAHAKGNNG